MDIIAAYREAGSYRGAAQVTGTTHKTVKRVIARHEAAGAAPPRVRRGRNYDGVAALVAERVEKTARADLGEAAAARRPRGGVCRVGPQLPAAGRGQ
jgi:transposase